MNVGLEAGVDMSRSALDGSKKISEDVFRELSKIARVPDHLADFYCKGLEAIFATTLILHAHKSREAGLQEEIRIKDELDKVASAANNLKRILLKLNLRSRQQLFLQRFAGRRSTQENEAKSGGAH
jgi:hypothetical protein